MCSRAARPSASPPVKGSGGPPSISYEGEIAELVALVHDALYAAKIVAYAQGMDLIARLSDEHDWNINLREMARIWKGGCIIRARFLDTIMKAYERNAELPNLLLDDALRHAVQSRQKAWRDVVGLAQQAGIPVSGMATGLAYFDSYRTADLPQNLNPRPSATPLALTRTSARTTPRVRLSIPSGWGREREGNDENADH